MQATEAIQTALSSTQNLFNQYIADLSDDDLLVRPVPGANHLAWQMGHLISAEAFLVNSELPDVPYPALPEGFHERYGKPGASDDDPKHFLKKVEYAEKFNSLREITKTAVGKLSDADLDRAT